MAYIDGFGQWRISALPRDPEPWLPPRTKLLPRRVIHYDVQLCPIGYWATREGALIRIRAMSDNHLRNSIAMLERGSRRRALRSLLHIAAYIAGAPEHAADAAEEASRELMSMADDPDINLAKLARLVYPKYRELTREQDRRREVDMIDDLYGSVSLYHGL